MTALCWIVVLLDGLDLFVYGATLPGVLDDKGFGLAPGTAGTIGSLTTFGMLIGALGSGIITDRVGRRKIIITGVAVFSVAAAAGGLAPTVVFFAVARFVAGIALGGLLPTAIAMVMEFAPASRKNIAVTVVMTAHQAGGAIAGGLGMVLVESVGWRWVYVLGALPAIVVLPVVIVMLPESLTFLLARGRTDRARTIADRFAVPLGAFTPKTVRMSSLRCLFSPSVRATTLLFWAASFARLLLVYGVNTWLPTMMRANGYDLGSAISFLLVINIGGIAGMRSPARSPTGSARGGSRSSGSR